MTTEGEFVDRIRAAEIAFACGQIRERIDYLTSETLNKS